MLPGGGGRKTMIDEVTIENLGVIERADLPLGAGFTAVTGETGAGKTMVVQALGLVLGGRASASVVRNGAERAAVEARWLIPDQANVIERVEDAGGSVDDGELIVTRTIRSDGRSRSSVGGRSAPVSVLTEIAADLVVVHGQSEQLRLRSEAEQRAMLDRFGGTPVQAALEEYQAAFDRAAEVEEKLETLTRDRDDRRAEADRLRAMIDRIEALAPREGEEAELLARMAQLGNAEALRLAATEAHEALASEADAPDAAAALQAATSAVERVAALDSSADALAERARDLSFQAADLATDIASYLASLEAGTEAELNQMGERLNALQSLYREYGPTEAEVLQRVSTGSDRLLELDSDDDTLQALEGEVEIAREERERSAAALTTARREAGAEFSRRVSAELHELAMPDAEIEVRIDERESFSRSGRDRVQVLLAPHPGQEAAPIAKAASGGELSRAMLAIEVVIAETDPVPTMVFDEVDAGVGGAAALEIGRRLAALAKTSQVIVVTHLAQVAAFADRHVRVRKSTDGAITASSIETLEGDARVTEMARLLSGLADSKTGLEHARELMRTAHAARA